MSSEWQVKTVGEFCPFKYGKGLPERDRKPGSFNVFSSAGLVGSHEAAHVNSAGVVIGRKGTVGSVTYSAAPFWPIDTAFYVEDEADKRDIRFTYYLLKTLGLHLMNTDSAVPGLNRDNAHAVEVFVPPLTVQRTIANFLQLIDDRITLLRETNATLEAIAQALFKSWFVDFDPVRAKMEGRIPEGMDEDTARLFPDALEESELGLVPRGWRVGHVADLGNVICGKTPPTAQAENYGCDVPFITIPDMHNLLAVTTTNRSLSYIGADTQKKKFLPAGSICISCIATPGLVVRVTVESQTNQQINSVVPLERWAKAFPLFLLRRIGDAVRAGGSGGSVFHNLSKSGFEELTVLLPSSELAVRFDQIIEPLVSKIISNQEQAQTLATLRDTLLPRLISGQLRLPDAEAVLENA